MIRFVLITRHPNDCAELQGLLTPCGLTLRPYPVLRLQDIDDDAGWGAAARVSAAPDASSWLVLASPRAPERFVRGCRERGIEHLLSLPVATVGPSTAHAAGEAGLRVELVGPGNARGLAHRLIDNLKPASDVVFACGRERRRELPDVLQEAGHTVFPVEVYRMVPTPPRELPLSGQASKRLFSRRRGQPPSISKASAANPCPVLIGRSGRRPRRPPRVSESSVAFPKNRL